jgi:hypothetical protein
MMTTVRGRRAGLLDGSLLEENPGATWRETGDVFVAILSPSYLLSISCICRRSCGSSHSRPPTAIDDAPAGR